MLEEGKEEEIEAEGALGIGFKMTTRDLFVRVWRTKRVHQDRKNEV
jgi:hypothetical protein